jgi:hypothetical protein
MTMSEITPISTQCIERLGNDEGIPSELGRFNFELAGWVLRCSGIKNYAGGVSVMAQRAYGDDSRMSLTMITSHGASG